MGRGGLATPTTWPHSPFLPMARTSSTTLANVVGVTPNEVFAMKLLTFDAGIEPNPAILLALEKKGFVSRIQGLKNLLRFSLTPKALTLLATFHY